MRSSIKYIIYFLLSFSWSVNALCTPCHLIRNESSWKIYKQCNNVSKLIKFNYQFYDYVIEDDEPLTGYAIMVYIPQEDEKNYEQRFIFDYKNMFVYDQKCTGAYLMKFDDNNRNNILLYTDHASPESAKIFRHQDFEKCKLPLSKWNPAPLY